MSSPWPAAQADLAREHRALQNQYGEVQRRCSALISQQAAQIATLQAEAMQLRAALIVRDTALACEREDRRALEAAIPGLPRRLTLARRVESLVGRVQDLMRELVRERLGWQRHAAALPAAAPTSVESAPAALGDLREKSVLCVGENGPGTTAAQRVVEMAGGRFLHHDGNDGDDGHDNDNSLALEASLVAADLVICQTGCVSHDAYWRVQDHCRRTGKQCVLVDQPQAMQFVRSAASTGETALAGHAGAVSSPKSPSKVAETP